VSVAEDIGLPTLNQATWASHECGHAFGAYLGRGSEDKLTFKILHFTDEVTGRKHMRCQASNLTRLSARGDYFHTIGGPLMSASVRCAAIGKLNKIEQAWNEVEPEYLLALAIKDIHTSDADIRACLKYAMVPEFAGKVRVLWGLGMMLGTSKEMLLKLADLTNVVQSNGSVELTQDELFDLIVHPKMRDVFEQKKAA
jgi:hypothetical protein